MSAPAASKTILYDVEQLAERLSASTKTVRRLIASGALPTVRIGRLVRIAEADLAIFVERHRES
jgi:excisionase family DNA binding protein